MRDNGTARNIATEARHDALPDGAGTTICVTNQKGGVGKTTTAVSLAAALAELGARILLVDLDPQGNASTGLGHRVEEGAPSTYGVLVDGQTAVEAIVATDITGLDLLPSSLDLAGAEVELVPAFSRELRLQRALEPVRARYDVILVDCPPSLGLLTINALVAADQVLVPIQCEYYALEGLSQLLRTVQLVGDNLNRELELGGVVLTMYDGRTNLAQQVVDEVRGYFGDRAYGTVIPRTVRLSEAPSFGQPITTFDPGSRGSRAYQRLAREVAVRLRVPIDLPEETAIDRLLAGAAGGTALRHGAASGDGRTRERQGNDGHAANGGAGGGATGDERPLPPPPPAQPDRDDRLTATVGGSDPTPRAERSAGGQDGTPPQADEEHRGMPHTDEEQSAIPHADEEVHP